MRFSIVILAFALTSCASITTSSGSDKTAADKPSAPGLAPQTLAAGECGLFLWTRDEPRQFIYFQQENRPSGLVYLSGRSLQISTSDITAGLGDRQAFALDYTDPAGKALTISGQYGETIEGGRRISSAKIKSLDAENWQHIIPANGVFACR